MKRITQVLFLVLLMVFITACKESAPNVGTFFESIPMPSAKINNVTKSEKADSKEEHIIYVNNYTYEDFYKYVMSLEELGFNYAFIKDYVPENKENLYDKTEASWGANNGKIWIRALWRDKDNIYYKGYNLQLIFNNYDYTIPIEKAE